MNLALVVLESEKFGFKSGLVSTTSVVYRACVEITQQVKKIPTQNAIIQAISIDELSHNLPEIFYIGLGTNPLNRAVLAQIGQGMPAFAAGQLGHASPIDSRYA